MHFLDADCRIASTHSLHTASLLPIADGVETWALGGYSLYLLCRSGAVLRLGLGTNTVVWCGQACVGQQAVRPHLFPPLTPQYLRVKGDTLYCGAEASLAVFA